jgi:3-hydroxybutyryl-CoA dehydratase
MRNPDKFFNDFTVGDHAEFSEIISEQTIREFAEFSQDKNLLHVDTQYAEDTPFKGIVAHGMIAAVLFSRFVGMYLPGKYSVYVRQNMNFRAPIYPGTEVVVYGEVIKKTISINLLTLSLRVFEKNSQVVFVDGEALVKVLK